MVASKQTRQGRSQDQIIDRLLLTGVLNPSERDGISGYQIHADYQQDQPTKEEVLKMRDERHSQKVAAGRLGGMKSTKTRRKRKRSRTEAEGQQTGSSNEAPIPAPDPGTKEKRQRRGCAARFPPKNRAVDGHNPPALQALP
jgi:hypothetical protein